MTTPNNIVLDPALQAPFPNTEIVSKKEYIFKRYVPKPKTAKTPAAKPKPPKKTAKKKNQTPKETGNEEGQLVAPDEERQGEGGEGSDSEDGDESDKQACSPNYLEHEDLQLCTSWLEITKDGWKGMYKSNWCGLLGNSCKPLSKQDSSTSATVEEHQRPLGPHTSGVKQISRVCEPNQPSQSKRYNSGQLDQHGPHVVQKASQEAIQKNSATAQPLSPLPESLPSSTPAETVNSTLDASGDKTARGGELARPNGRKKGKGGLSGGTT
ncbi:hypothetical protein PGTUg99_003028 [Puccinia graminis f. sp. tritici]|uniref:No apical meristem-associated C-terminal domain-containing protein n=1 Tax=Puccinia graminis f. sp. tritici TaxID=56615 RepID=A0A5B0S352_PUCGR|nr:hypothetical protein PGTUg99_003028 [Puccinia graminis f. sp. tritici]